MTLTGSARDQAHVVGEIPESRQWEDEKRELFIAALPMLFVFAIWLVAQIWLMGPFLRLLM